MKYELWSVISMTEGESLQPFCKLDESDDFQKIYETFMKNMEAKELSVIVANKEQIPSLHKTNEKIYESPDGGKTIYERTCLNYERKQI